MMKLLCLLFLVSVSFQAEGSYELILCNATLPQGYAYAPTIYDGKDSIYILGGIIWPGFGSRDIFRYNISTESVDQIGQLPNSPSISHYGSGVAVGNRILLYNPTATYPEILEIDVTVQPVNTSVFARLPYRVTYLSPVYDEVADMYINAVSGNIGSILRVSIPTADVQVVASLPTVRYTTSAVWDKEGDCSYIFGGRSTLATGYLNDILRFKPEGTVFKLNVTLPVPTGHTTAVWTGSEAFIIGGYTDVANDWPNVVRFNPLEQEVTPVDIQNFPDKLYGAGAVFVEKLNRIYVIGGRFNSTYMDQIAYFDLDSQSER